MTLQTIDQSLGRCCAWHIPGAPFFCELTLTLVAPCCDPDDCGPCCERCLTCPTLARSRKEPQP